MSDVTDRVPGCPRCSGPADRTCITRNHFFTDPKRRPDGMLLIDDTGHVHMHDLVIAESVRGLLACLLRERIRRAGRWFLR